MIIVLDFLKKVVENISINIIGYEGKKSWDGDGPTENILGE